MKNLTKINNLGIIGGTFDPIHFGHIGCAEAAIQHFDIDEVWFMPANHPNFKKDNNVSCVEDRLEMCRLAIQDHGNAKFKVSDFETEREGITYTSDTLEILHGKFPSLNLYFITGSDAVINLYNWYNYEKVLSLATIIAVTRKGYFKPNESQEKFLNDNSDKIKVIEADVIDASSSEIRQLIKNTEDISKFVCASVQEYIQENKLYM